MRTNLLAGIGLALMGASVIAWSVATQPATPGRLVPSPVLVTVGGPAASSANLATFTLDNVGGAPVRIASVTSGCGCATPTVRTTTVAPGRTGTVTVSMSGATLAVGERTALISLQTDSPASPEVTLRLRMVGSRRPPFLAAAVGDLVFGSGFTVGDSRPISVEVVERGRPDREPAPASDLPFLRIVKQGMSEEADGNDPGVFHRDYNFRVELAEPPPGDTFLGRITVADPWDADRVLALNVHGERPPPVRVAPARGVLTLKDPADRTASLSFVVMIKDPRQDLRIEPEGGADSSLIVERAGADQASARAIDFAVRLKPGRAVAEGIYRVIVRPTSPPADAIVVPIQVREERPS